MGGIFGGWQNLKYFFGVLEIPDIFWGERWMLGVSLRMKKKMRSAPTPLWDYKAREDTICTCIYQWITFSLHF